MNSLSIGIVLPIIFTVIGWFVVARQAERREIRKEVRDRIQDLKACISDVQRATTYYWLEASKAQSIVGAIRLKSDLKRLGLHISLLENAGLSFDGSQTVAEIRKVATGGNFEGAKRRKLPGPDGERVATTASLLEDLMQHSEAAFYDAFSMSVRKSKFWAGIPLIGSLLVADDSN